MADIENNSTHTPLPAFGIYTGKSNQPNVDYITIAVSFTIDVPGTLTILHSADDITYHSFGDELSFTAGSHSYQVSRKLSYFKVQYLNGAEPQGEFQLFTRILKNLNQDLSVSVNKDFDTITVFPPGTGFLSSEHDSITIPTLDACITGVANDSLKVFVVNQSGGSASNVQIFDSNGASLLSDGDGKLQVSGSFDVGLTNYALEDNGHLESIDAKLNIVQGLTFLNNKLVVDTGITGYATNSKLDEIKTAINDKHLNSATDSVTVNLITGFATSSLQTSGNTKLDDIKTAIDNKHLDSTTDSVTVNLITGFATSSLQTSANTKLDTINTTITNKHLSSETDSVGVTGSVHILNYPSVQDVLITNTEPISVTGLNVVIPSSITVSNFPVSFEISNFPTSTEISNFPVSFEISSLPDVVVSSIVPITITAMPHLNAEDDSVTVNVISGFATETKQDTQIEELIKIVDKTGDITAEIPHSQGASVWADSIPAPVENPNSPSGWLYQNAEAGNAMNLFYFNGNSETKTLSQVVGQYAVVTNLASVINDKLIFAVYTKSNTSFFTTRITHSPASGVDMVPGGKYLLYWGAVADDIFPNLPRLNFTDITTTGPADSTEQILSVTINTDSSATAGSVVILIESLGVVFSDGPVYQSRVYNLITDNTEYFLTASNTQYNQSTYNYLNNLGKTNNALDTYIVNSSLTISNTTFDIGNLPSTQNTFITNDAFTPVPVSFSGGIDVNNTVDVLITNVEPISISGIVDINNFPAIQQVAFDGGITVNNFPLVQEVSFSSGITVNNFPTSILSKTQDASGNNITSTDLSGKNGLDTASNIFGYAGSTRTALTCDSAGKMLVKNYTADGLGNEITSTTTSTSTNSLDTASSLYVSSGTNRTALTSTGSSLNTNITNTVPVSGTVAFSNTSIEVSNFPATQPVSGTVAISNSSIDSHIYGSSNGTDWHHILTTPQGKILNNSSTQDGNGTNITSTLTGVKQGLDVYVSNTTQSSVFTDLGNATGSDITATRIALDTAACLYTTDASTRFPLTSTAISSIRALDVNVANSSVPVSGTFWQATQPVSGTVAFSNTSIAISGTASVSDTTSQSYLNTINNAIGERPASFALGNLINNGSLPAGNFSTEQTFTKGLYGRNTLIIYKDSNTSNTGSISVYSSTTSGTPSNVLLGTFYPISNGTFRQFTGTFNLLPFASLFIRNDSDATVTSVYVSYVNG